MRSIPGTVSQWQSKTGSSRASRPQINSLVLQAISAADAQQSPEGGLLPISGKEIVENGGERSGIRQPEGVRTKGYSLVSCSSVAPAQVRNEPQTPATASRGRKWRASTSAEQNARYMLRRKET